MRVSHLHLERRLPPLLLRGHVAGQDSPGLRIVILLLLLMHLLVFIVMAPRAVLKSCGQREYNKVVVLDFTGFEYIDKFPRIIQIELASSIFCNS